MHNNKVILTNEVKYKLVDDKKYGRYWIVEDSKDIFKGITRNELRKQAYKYILNGNTNFKDLIDPIDNKKIKFIKFNHKMRLIPSIKNLIDNANIKYYSPLVHNNKLFKKGINNYQGVIKVDNITYKYIIRIGIAKHDYILYDLTL